jgi:pimeloyl-ACP methyl ester carboxylesterase
MTENTGKPLPKAPVHSQAPSLVRGTMGSLSRVAPGLAARLAADLFMRPSRIEPPTRELEWLEDSQPLKLTTRHGDMSGWSWGEGPAVILLHGWNGRGSQMGLLARAVAGAGFRAVAFDGPAHGKSPGRRTNLINHSAALVDAARELPALTKAVMISPPAEMKIYSRMFIDAIGASDEVHDRMVAIYRKKFGVVWDDITVENLAPKPETALLVVHDRSDRQAPFSHGERTCCTWPDARLHATDGLGHLRILRDEGVASVVASFLAGDVD